MTFLVVHVYVLEPYYVSCHVKNIFIKQPAKNSTYLSKSEYSATVSFALLAPQPVDQHSSDLSKVMSISFALLASQTGRPTLLGP